MVKNVKKYSVFILILCFAFIWAPFSYSVHAESSEQNRIFGLDRYKTAVSIAQHGWPSGSEYVVLARGDEFPDALCAGPLANKYGAPILLTEPNGMNSDTLDEIKALGAKHVIIIGGPGAVSPSVEDAIKASGVTDVERIWGNNRLETSLEIAKRLDPNSSVALATGEDFPDALSISAIASKLGMPILLVNKDSIPEGAMQFIKDRNVTATYVIGGAGVISLSAVSGAPGVVRLGGNDRFETNAVVLNQFADVLNFGNIYIAVGDGPNRNEFADALSGAVLAAKTSAPVVLAYGTLADAISNFLKLKVTPETNVVALGGVSVVPQSIVDMVVSYVNNPGQGAGEIGGGVPPVVVPPGGAEVPSVSMSIMYHGLPDSETIGSTGTIDARAMSTSTQVYGFKLQSDKDCVFKYVSLTDANGYEVFEGLSSTPTVTLKAGVPGELSIYDIASKLGISDIEDFIGTDGIELGSLRTLCSSKAVLTGSILIDGQPVGDIEVTLLLPAL